MRNDSFSRRSVVPSQRRGSVPPGGKCSASLSGITGKFMAPRARQMADFPNGPRTPPTTSVARTARRRPATSRSPRRAPRPARATRPGHAQALRRSGGYPHSVASRASKARRAANIAAADIVVVVIVTFVVVTVLVLVVTVIAVTVIAVIADSSPPQSRSSASASSSSSRSSSTSSSSSPSHKLQCRRVARARPALPWAPRQRCKRTPDCGPFTAGEG